MTDYFDSKYFGHSDTSKKITIKPELKPELDGSIDKKTLKVYGLSKPQRVKVVARVIHDPDKE